MAYKRSSGSKFLDWLFGYNVANKQLEKEQEFRGLSDEAMKEYTEDGFITRGISNWWNKVTGKGLTDADKEANQFSASQADLAYQRQREFYQEFQSPEAQMKSQMNGMQSLGVNPAMMYGGSMPSGGGSSSPSSASSVSPSSGESLGSFISVMLNALKVGAEIKNINADTRLKDTGAKKNEGETRGIEIANWIKDQTKGFEVLKADLQNKELQERINNLAADSELKGSQLIINGKQVDYLESMIEVNASIVEVNGSTIAKQTQDILESQARIHEITSKIRLNNANAENIEAITPYMSDYYDSLIALQDARTDEAKEHAALLIKSTAVKALEVAKEKKLLDEGYYDDLIDKLHFDADTAASQSVEAEVGAKNAAADAAIANASAVVQTITSIISAFAGAGIGYRQFKGSPRATRTTTYDAKGNIVSVSQTDQSKHFQ